MTKARHPAAALAFGVVALEFAAAMQAFVASTLLPFVARDLHAGSRLGLLLAGSTIGLFIALPLAPRAIARAGAVRTLTLGLCGYVGGSVLAASATGAWVFAAGQLLAGLAAGLVAVFGVSAIIRQLPTRTRVRVIAASSAMWIVPALVGPPLTLAAEHAVGWRWALLLPVPIVLAGRALVLRGAHPDRPDGAPPRPLGRTLLVPLGVTVVVVAATRPGGWVAALPGLVIAAVGVAGLLPAGTARLRRGTPAAIAAMSLFAVGYFGADALVTVLLTGGYGTSPARAGIVLSAAPLAWALTSLAVPRLSRTRGGAGLSTVGLPLAAVAAAGLAVFLVNRSYPAALAAWTAGGAGIGLAYPGLYLLCTTGPPGATASTAADLATAVITAEAFGGLVGRALGGAIVSVAAQAHLAAGAGLAVAYGMFALLLALAATASTRARPPAEQAQVTPAMEAADTR